MIPLGSQPNDAFAEEAKRMMDAGLGKAELELVASYTAPFFWLLRHNGQETFKNGSVFFLDTGAKIFAVTAAHVVEECFADARDPTFVACMFGNQGHSVEIQLGDRLIDCDHDLDIATFSVSQEEVGKIGKLVLRGFQKDWPPQVMQKGRGVLYAGFPGNGRIQLGPRALEFGCIMLSGIATSVSEEAVSVLIERDMLTRALGNDPFPENFDFGGISGGPIIAIVETASIRSWIPVGVIIQGPNPTGNEAESIAGFELIRARPIQYILRDGSLDHDRWAKNNMHRAR